MTIRELPHPPSACAPGDLDGSYSEDEFAPIERTMSSRSIPTTQS
jgi:hypothetical protein